MLGPIPALTIRNRQAQAHTLRFYFTKFPCGSDTITVARLRARNEDMIALEKVRNHLGKAYLTVAQKQVLERAIRAITRCTSPPVVQSAECTENAAANVAQKYVG